MIAFLCLRVDFDSVDHFSWLYVTRWCLQRSSFTKQNNRQFKHDWNFIPALKGSLRKCDRTSNDVQSVRYGVVVERELLNALWVSGQSVTEICQLKYYIACFFPRRDASHALSMYIVESLSFYGSGFASVVHAVRLRHTWSFVRQFQYARLFSLKTVKQRLTCLKLTDFLYYFKFNPWSSSSSISTSQHVMHIIIPHSRQSAPSVSYLDPTNPKDKFSSEDKCGVSVRLSRPAEWWLVWCFGNCAVLNCPV
jgi:hypothetical protein